LTIKDDVLRAYIEAKKALTNYSQAMEEFKNVYDSVLEGLAQKYPNSKMKSKWHGTELLELNPDRSESALLVANFFGDEVFASLALLLCLEVCDIFDFRIFAIPVASKTIREDVDFSFRATLIKFLEMKRIKLLVLFSQAHPYLDGFYIEIPSVVKKFDKSQQIVKEVAEHGHEVGAFSEKFDKPTYSVVSAGADELISIASRKGIESYRLMISQDIFAGYRATLALLER
jgi:hypothetical protein